MSRLAVEHGGDSHMVNHDVIGAVLAAIAARTGRGLAGVPWETEAAGLATPASGGALSEGVEQATAAAVDSPPSLFSRRRRGLDLVWTVGDVVSCPQSKAVSIAQHAAREREGGGEPG
jgi:hypothetical protein